MKKLLILVILGSFMGVSITANACDEHKAKAKKASTQTVTGAQTATTTAPVSKDAKKECTSHDRKECIEKTGKDCSKEAQASSTPSCCAKKASTKKS